MDALILSRIQFAANISFHILFPTITIALCWFLLFFRLRFLKTRDPAWEEAYYFWTKVFALTFALGVVSGIVMSFQFGTNWPGFMEKTGDISGPLLGYEVLTAFFLEASFLGIMLFGRGRVSERVHLMATMLVAAGTTLSAFWILSLNSWMQTPAGFEIVDGKFIPVDWLSVVFNPSFPYRFTHKLLASTLTASFLIAGLCAWQLIKGSATGGTHKALRTAIVAASVAMPLQFLVGDMHGLNTLEHQPAKIAALEGIWHTGSPMAGMAGFREGAEPGIWDQPVCRPAAQWFRSAFAKRNIVKKVMGMSIFQTSVILLYVSFGVKMGATIPIIGHGHEDGQKIKAHF